MQNQPYNQKRLKLTVTEQFFIVCRLSIWFLNLFGKFLYTYKKIIFNTFPQYLSQDIEKPQFVDKGQVNIYGITGLVSSENFHQHLALTALSNIMKIICGILEILNHKICIEKPSFHEIPEVKICKTAKRFLYPRKLWKLSLAKFS